jgi:hypothetical protein
MGKIIVLVLAAVALTACNPDSNSDVTGSLECANKMFTPYNPKNLKQCVAACIACDRGVTTTCSTSCTMKGAQ